MSTNMTGFRWFSKIFAFLCICIGRDMVVFVQRKSADIVAAHSEDFIFLPAPLTQNYVLLYISLVCWSERNTC